MSSSGKGQSRITDPSQIDQAWHYAQDGGRAGKGRVIVEQHIDFDFEITLLTVQHRDGVSFCDAIGHRQQDGDYRESWQPQPMSPLALARAREIAEKVTAALGGWGLFGVELFIRGDDVIFSEVSPRPHDTGLVTLISQSLSEFALHSRAILGLPIPAIRSYGPSASSVILVNGDSQDIRYQQLDLALQEPHTDLRLFGKPEVKGSRRMGVALAQAETIEDAREKAVRVSEAVTVVLK
jgi:phosphoribosylglycinamide formyltransferase 2